MATKWRRVAGGRPILPTWISSYQPLHLNSALCRRICRDFDPMGIFLNIPYSDRYSNLQIAILSTVTAYDLTPRMARERSRLEARLPRIFELICTCKYGLTDLSYANRMNMPLELGLLLALGKETFVISRRSYSALKTISDLNFGDIEYHDGSIRRLIATLSLWIQQNCSPKTLTTATLLERYQRLRQMRTIVGDDFDRIRPSQIAGFLGVASDEFDMILPS